MNIRLYNKRQGIAPKRVELFANKPSKIKYGPDEQGSRNKLHKNPIAIAPGTEVTFLIVFLRNGRHLAGISTEKNPGLYLKNELMFAIAMISARTVTA